jgi:hypothetical protein
MDSCTLQQARVGHYANNPRLCRRKYFSSLERLQIRQHSLDDQHAAERSLSSRASSSVPLRPSLNLAARRRTRKPNLSFESLKVCPDALHRFDVSHADIDLFFSLPEKLRKLHYSREEQALLLAKCEQAFLPCDYDCERAQQRFSDFHFGFQKDPYPSTIRGRGRSPTPSLSLTRSLSEDSSVSPRTALFSDSAQELDQHAESSLIYLDMMSPATSRRSASASALRRTMSLSGSSMQYSTSPAVLMGTGFTIPAAPTHQRAHSSSLSGRRSSHTPTPPIFDPEATHYRDPEARKKLRTYLASPQKFDEAIEFGFPSTTGDDDSASPHYQLPPITSHSRKFSRDMQTFLRDGKLSFFDSFSTDNQGLESDADSVPDADSPTTPSSTGHPFRLHTRQFSHSKFSSDGSSPMSPMHPGTGHLNREMTLRMTLTRPDLRADDDQLYGWQEPSPKPPRDDPLALEELVFSDDTTGTQGAFYVKPKPRGNLVTRMLKRASLKGR